jgi:hypothetical protein
MPGSSDPEKLFALKVAVRDMIRDADVSPDDVKALGLFVNRLAKPSLEDAVALAVVEYLELIDGGESLAAARKTAEKQLEPGERWTLAAFLDAPRERTRLKALVDFELRTKFKSRLLARL